MTAVEQPRPGGVPEDAERPAAGSDRAALREAMRRFRPRRLVPAVITAALLAVGAVLVAAEIISGLFGRSAGVLPVDRLARLGRETGWDDALTYVVAGVAIGLGLLLLWLALVPGRVRALPLAADRPGVVMVMSRSAVQQVAAHAAETVDGVAQAQARARAGRGTIAVRVDTPLREPGDLADRVQGAVAERIGRYAPLRRQRVRVGVRRRRG